MIPSCSLTRAGLAAQRDRYARLAPHVSRRALNGRTLTVEFTEGFDHGTLEEMVATERECCPFFDLSFDDLERRLTVAVREHEHEPALTAISAALAR